MDWFQNERHLFLLAVVFYGLSLLYSVFLWRKGFRHHNRVNYCLLLAGFGFQTISMLKRGVSFARCPVNNLYEAMLFVDWTIVTVYLLLGLWSRLNFLGAFTSPILFGVGVFALMPNLDTPYAWRGPVGLASPYGSMSPMGPYEWTGHSVSAWSSLHAALILLSFGAFGLSSIAAAMYLTQEHNLKFRKLQAVFSLLPPIERLELAVSRLLLAGFILLTVGLAVGGYYLHQTRGGSFITDPEILWSGFVWVLYLGLVAMRWWFLQGGRRIAWGAVGSFAFVMLTFWGFYLISGIHHP